MVDSAYLADKMAQAITEANFLSLHIDDPGGTGENEVSGGTPAYARLPVTGWTKDYDGSYVATVSGMFNVPANTDVQWAVLWKDVTYLDKAPAYAHTVVQDTVEVLALRFTVPSSSDEE